MGPPYRRGHHISTSTLGRHLDPSNFEEKEKEKTGYRAAGHVWIHPGTKKEKESKEEDGKTRPEHEGCIEVRIGKAKTCGGGRGRFRRWEKINYKNMILAVLNFILGPVHHMYHHYFYIY